MIRQPLFQRKVPCSGKEQGRNVSAGPCGVTRTAAVERLGGCCRGVKKVTVDGKEISGNVLPAFGDGKTHKAEVILG